MVIVLSPGPPGWALDLMPPKMMSSVYLVLPRAGHRPPLAQFRVAPVTAIGDRFPVCPHFAEEN